MKFQHIYNLPKDSVEVSAWVHILLTWESEVQSRNLTSKTESCLSAEIVPEIKWWKLLGRKETVKTMNLFATLWMCEITQTDNTIINSVFDLNSDYSR